MIDGSQKDHAIALWKSESASAAHMSMEEMRRRADLLDAGFRGTTFVPWSIAVLIVLGASFALIVANVLLYKFAASIGIVAGIYFGLAAQQLINRTVDAKLTCIQAYKFQLRQQRDSLMVCGTTFLLIAAACALGNAPLGAIDLRSIGGMIVSASPGLISYWYVRRRANRFQQRIEEVAVIERA